MEIHALGAGMATDQNQLQRRITGLTALQNIAQELMTELDLERLLRNILRAAVDVLNASEGSLWFWEPTDELIVLVSEDPGLVGYRMSASEGIAGWVFTNCEPLIVGDVNQDERFAQRVDDYSGFQTQSLIAVPLMTPTEKLGVLQVVNKKSGGQFDELDQDILGALSAQAAVIYVNARLVQELEQEKNRIIALQDEMNKKTARDLHDGPAQMLGAMMMNVEFILKLYDREPERVPSELQELRAAAAKTLDQVRNAMFQLRPLVLETQGLKPALEQYVERRNTKEGMNIHLEWRGPEERLPERVESLCFAIVHEAIGNVKKHAEAEHAWIVVERTSNRLAVAVRDDGVGFDVSATQADYDARGSLGLLNMQERAEVLGARYAIESAPGKGTLVYVIVPLSGLKENAADAASAQDAFRQQRKRTTGPLGFAFRGPEAPGSNNERRKGTGPLGVLGQDGQDES
jgi:signal transduction histidine kinase